MHENAQHCCSLIVGDFNCVVKHLKIKSYD